MIVVVIVDLIFILLLIPLFWLVFHSIIKPFGKIKFIKLKKISEESMEIILLNNKGNTIQFLISNKSPIYNIIKEKEFIIGDKISKRELMQDDEVNFLDTPLSEKDEKEFKLLKIPLWKRMSLLFLKTLLVLFILDILISTIVMIYFMFV